MVAQDCRDLMSNCINVCIIYVSRVQNSNTHNLASLAKVAGTRTWFGVAPVSSLFPV